VPITIARETPLQDDVRRLVADLDAFLTPLSPPQFQFQLSVDDMTDHDTHLFVARDETGAALGMGALKVHDAEYGELKRMYTVPEARRRRVGSLILGALEDHARSLGLSRVRLETGTEAMMPAAHRLYRHAGYAACPAFADYPTSEHNAFFERAL